MKNLVVTVFFSVVLGAVATIP